MSEKPLSGKGVVLRCSWCKNEQRVDLGNVYAADGANAFLHLMTGGWSGKAPFDFRPTSKDDPPNPLLETQIGQSVCCKKQLEGELFGYEEEPCG